MAKIIFVAAFVLDVVARKLIDSVVCQVHVQIVQIVLIRWSILARGQSAEALFVKENTERINTTQQNIDSQIELQFINEEWLV